MKRIFAETDASIPDTIWNQFPQKKVKLQRIIELEDQLDSLLTSKIRSKFTMNADRPIKQKILRMYVHHTFVPQTFEDRAHFLLSLEGQILDEKYRRTAPMGDFFEKIRFSPDLNLKRANMIDRTCEWTATAFAEGLTSSCFRAKLYLDKATNIKIFLHRRNNIRPRYEISSKLRTLLPLIQLDPTEDEVMLALWQYLIQKNLFIDGRERKVIRCDDILKDVCGADSVLLSTLKSKIFEHLLPCKPIQVDYVLTTANTNFDERFNAAAMSKAGGKAFDLQVDLPDTFPLDHLEDISNTAAATSAFYSSILQTRHKANFIAKAIADRAPELDALQRIIKSSENSDGDSDALSRDATVGRTLESSVDMFSSADISELVNRACDLQKLIATRSRGDGHRTSSPVASAADAAITSNANETQSEAVVNGGLKRSGSDISIKQAPDMLSTIHTFRGFVDVGNDEIFAESGSSSHNLLGDIVTNSWLAEAVAATLK